ncbi:MAG: methyltransferase [Clostridia bacterium]|nr:methyltransferase [Clostridia bacterium]
MNQVHYTTGQTDLVFNSDRSLFSPNAIDKGTLAMLNAIILHDQEKILDLGCGYGFAGIYLIKVKNMTEVVFSDISETAVLKTRENLRINHAGENKVILSDGFLNVHDNDFTLILSNPPYHSDFSVPKHFIEKGFHHLALGGRMVMVTKRKEWYKNKFIAVFGGVKIQEADGYYVFEAEKRSIHFSGRKK